MARHASGMVVTRGLIGALEGADPGLGPGQNHSRIVDSMCDELLRPAAGTPGDAHRALVTAAGLR